jgi:hypothetical protein
LFSSDPVAAATCYRKYFCGNTHGRWQDTNKPRMYGDMAIGPVSSVICDNVSLIIFPIAYPKKVHAAQWQGRTDFESSKGHVVDHISFSYDNLADSLERLRKDGVKVTDEIRSAANGKMTYAFIEGPEKIRIEVIEGRAKKE